MARRMAYLPQGQTLHWPLSVERLVALGRLPHLAPFSRMTDAEGAAIEAAIRRADVGHLRHRNAVDLSGGNASASCWPERWRWARRGGQAPVVVPLACVRQGDGRSCPQPVTGAGWGGG